jgi:hypothetical protein
MTRRNIENPCEDQQLETQEIVREPCGPGRIRNEAGDCVPAADVAAQPDVVPTPPPPEDPFPENVLRQQRDFQLLDAESADRNIEDILYASAIRDITTIDESSFFNIDNSTVSQIGTYTVNHSSFWFGQKEMPAVVDYIDRFRLALMNLWYFNGVSENLIFSAVGNPRVNEGIANRPEQNSGLLRALLDPSLVISFSPNPTAPYSLVPVQGDPYYDRIESMPFTFDVPKVERAKAPFPDGVTLGQYMDFYMDGESSPFWSAGDLAENLFGPDFWPSNPILRDIYVPGNLEYEKEFFDYTFDAPVAFFESEMDNILVSPFDSADITVSAQSQEIYQDIESELEIPSVYQYYQAKQIERRIGDDERLQENLPPGLVEFNQRVSVNFEEFFNENEFDTRPVFKFPSDKVEKLEEINEAIRGTVPNYVEISINTTQAGPINAALQRNKMDLIMLEAFSYTNPKRAAGPEEEAFDEARIVTRREESIMFTKVLDDKFITADNVDQEEVNVTVNDQAVQGLSENIVRDIDKIVSAVSNLRFREFSWPRSLEEYPLYYSGWESKPRLQLEELIRSQIFLAQLQQLLKENKLERTFADILYGSKAYSEVIGYKVEKYRIDINEQNQEIENKVQEFFFMDNDAIERFSFIDSQVLPDKKYNYKIFTINFVVGARYEYSSDDTSYFWRSPDGLSLAVPGKESPRFNLGVYSGNSIALIKAPFFEKTVSLADKPPLSPQVSFLPYQGVDNKYAVLLQSNNGEAVEKPIQIFEADQEIIADTYRSQNRRPGSEVLYKSDSLPTHFEAIRIEDPPETYEDFSSSAFVVKKEATGKTGFFIFDVEPNKYYYYIFRTYDDGGVSNPTEVFRVRMVSYQNGIFMEMEPYEMYVKPKEFNMSFERLLKISPSADQKIVNFEKVFDAIRNEEEESSTLMRIRKELDIVTPVNSINFQASAPSVDDVDLGNQTPEDSVWGKDFKIRCISKTTGKKIDINITFNKSKTTLVPDR